MLRWPTPWCPPGRPRQARRASGSIYAFVLQWLNGGVTPGALRSTTQQNGVSGQMVGGPRRRETNLTSPLSGQPLPLGGVRENRKVVGACANLRQRSTFQYS